MENFISPLRFKKSNYVIRLFSNNVKQNSGKLFDQFWIPRVPFIYHHFKVVVVKMLKFGHFGLKIGPLSFWNFTWNLWDYETRAQELTSGAIRMLLSFFVKVWEFFKDGRVWGFFGGGQFGLFLQFLIYLRFGWTNLDEIGNQIEGFLML